MDKIINEAKASVLPYESWLRLAGESALAYAAFCVYRDFGSERNIIKAVETVERNESDRNKKCRVWRNWSTQFQWRERAGDYDNYMEQLKQGELRKTIEAQGEMHRKVTGKMLEVVSKKLDTMNPDDLTHNNVTEWVQTAIKTEREAAGLINSGGKQEPKQGELNFFTDFEGL
jgi:hypothetical protein